MIEYLAIALLILMVASHIALQAHCFRFRKSLPLVASEASERTVLISDLLEASAAALEDIADLLEGGAGSVPAMGSSGPSSNPVSQLITSLLMSKMSMPSEYGPSNEVRTIHEEHPPQVAPEEDN